MRNLHTLHLWPILALAHLIFIISGSTSLRPVLTGSTMAYLNSRVAFTCVAPKAVPPVTYELRRDNIVATGTDHQGGQPVPFFLKVSATSEGLYYCTAKTKGSSGDSNSITLTVVIPPSGTTVTSDPFPPVAYRGSSLILSCNVTKGSHLSYSWFFKRTEVKSSSSPFFRTTGNKLVIEKASPEHAGPYSCMAWSAVQDIKRFSSSSEVPVTVKEHVSKPRISFSISKEEDGYHGNVTCWSSRGSPPVQFSLSLDNKEVGSVTASDSLVAQFHVAMVPGQVMGVARCRVKTEVQELMSDPLTVEVVPVGGDVKVDVEYFYTADSKVAAVRLRCHISRGTFPYVSWLFNDSVLSSVTNVDSHTHPVEPHYAFADHRRILILARLGPEESGYYRCKARDSYDEAGLWMESEDVLVRVRELFMSTIEGISITFCFFLLLILMVSGAIVYRMFDHKQVDSHVSITNSVVPPLSANTSRSRAKPPDLSSTDSSIHNQTIEVTL
ncbi:Fc receptor-like protein 5 isoform X2 [Sphaeramia orbicularis]|uniref:Fc receptor-like protein 5 isoform X2 n=1 Tax=Sphaeramia orbicularis TaxID=375764 RepID=UPI00117C1767|nr:Fc receptor-like protein 5 isoform X2 [Sphaeramia orbicularis]